MPDERAHDVHLRMTGARVGAGAVDFFKYHRRLSHTQSSTAKLLGYERREPSRVCQRAYKVLRITRMLVERLPVGAAKFPAQLSNRLAILAELARAGVDICHDSGFGIRDSGFAIRPRLHRRAGDQEFRSSRNNLLNF